MLLATIWAEQAGALRQKSPSWWRQFLQNLELIGLPKLLHSPQSLVLLPLGYSPSYLQLRHILNTRSLTCIKLNWILAILRMTDKIQQSIAVLIKPSAFHVAVLALKELVHSQWPYFGPPCFAQLDQQGSAFDQSWCSWFIWKPRCSRYAIQVVCAWFECPTEVVWFACSYFLPDQTGKGSIAAAFLIGINANQTISLIIRMLLDKNVHARTHSYPSMNCGFGCPSHSTLKIAR